MWCSQDTTLCVKPETTKFLEENRCSFLPDIGLSNIYIYIFWICFLLDKGNRNRNKQMGLHQTKMFLHYKGNYQQNEKAAYWMGEDICKWYIG